MDETQVETAKTSSESLGFFTPHRRRHLQSETYRTLLRIFSQCYGDSFAAQNLDRNENTENGSNVLLERTEEQGSEPVEVVGGDSVEFRSLVSERETQVNLQGDDNDSQDKGISEQMAIYQIEELMGFEENEDLSNQKDVNFGSGPEQMIIDELEHIVKGNEDIVCDNNFNPLRTSLLPDQSCSNEVESSNGQAERAEFQQVDMSKPGDVSQMLLCLDDVVTSGSAISRAEDKHSLLNIDPTRPQEVMALNSASDLGSNCPTFTTLGDTKKGENHAQIVCDDFSLSSDKSTVSIIMDLCNDKDDQRLAETNELKVEHEKRLKDKELEKPDCGGDMVDSADHITKDIDMEEGEISAGYIKGDISVDILLEDSEGQDKKVNDEPINGFITNKNDFSLETPFFPVDRFGNSNSLVGLGESDKNNTVNAPEKLFHEETMREGACTNDSMLEPQSIEKKDNDGNNNTVRANIMEEDSTRQDKTSTEKDAEVRPKKMRGPLTKEKKARKKEKDRKRRAEKNRQLGVRRLKLHSISKPEPKPKPVKYCRHYTYGRCQEGEKCNFSHDMVPLTKSKPCCHFARHSCMKGDDCPFDHQLSKYPCSNFASKGFCSRGDGCMFLHKVLPTEDATTSLNAVEPETKFASLRGGTTPLKQQNNVDSSMQASRALSFSTQLHPRKSTEKNLSEPFMKQFETVAKGASFLSVGNSSLVDKLKQQISSLNGDGDCKVGKSGAVRNSNELSNRTTPVATLKGVNFLSFRRVQRDDLSGSKLASCSSNGGSGVKLSPLDSSNMPSQTLSAPSSDSVLKGVQPAVRPKGINFLSFGRVQQDNSSGSRLASSSTNGDSGVKLSPLGNSNMPNQTSSAPSSVSMPKGINFLSFGKASTVESSLKGKAKLLSEADSGTDGCIVSQHNALDKPQQQSTVSLASHSSTISPIQTLDHSASKIYKESPYLAQKALLSTLAFAARYERPALSNQPTHDPAVHNEIAKANNGTIGGSQNNLARDSKVLAFLSSIGGKSKQ